MKELLRRFRAFLDRWASRNYVPPEDEPLSDEEKRAVSAKAWSDYGKMPHVGRVRAGKVLAESFDKRWDAAVDGAIADSLADIKASDEEFDRAQDEEDRKDPLRSDNPLMDPKNWESWDDL